MTDVRRFEQGQQKRMLLLDPLRNARVLLQQRGRLGLQQIHERAVLVQSCVDPALATGGHDLDSLEQHSGLRIEHGANVLTK